MRSIGRGRPVSKEALGELPSVERLAGGSGAATKGAMAPPWQASMEALTSGSSNPQESAEGTTKKAKTGGSAVPTAPFFMSDCLPPVPAKLVAKIVKRDNVDMAELLRDNIEAERWRTDHPSSSSASSHANRREVPDILSWLQCFGVYASVVPSHKPEKFRQLMAYQTHMIRVAQQCGGTGWQGYDTMFRQLAATVPSTYRLGAVELRLVHSNLHGTTKRKRKDVPVLPRNGPPKCRVCIGPQKAGGTGCRGRGLGPHDRSGSGDAEARRLQWRVVVWWGGLGSSQRRFHQVSRLGTAWWCPGTTTTSKSGLLCVE